MLALTRQAAEASYLARFCTLEPAALAALTAHGFDGESFPGGIAQPQALSARLRRALAASVGGPAEGPEDVEEPRSKRPRNEQSDESPAARASGKCMIPSLKPVDAPFLGPLRRQCREIVSLFSITLLVFLSFCPFLSHARRWF